MKFFWILKIYNWLSKISESKYDDIVVDVNENEATFDEELAPVEDESVGPRKMRRMMKRAKKRKPLTQATPVQVVLNENTK